MVMIVSGRADPFHLSVLSPSTGPRAPYPEKTLSAERGRRQIIGRPNAWMLGSGQVGALNSPLRRAAMRSGRRDEWRTNSTAF
jgi:hypothetical protein